MGEITKKLFINALYISKYQDQKNKIEEIYIGISSRFFISNDCQLHTRPTKKDNEKCAYYKR